MADDTTRSVGGMLGRMAKRDPRFVEAAFEELAQGNYSKNESMAFTEIPEYLMAEAEWAWRAGYTAGRVDAEQKRIFADDLPSVQTHPMGGSNQ